VQPPSSMDVDFGAADEPLSDDLAEELLEQGLDVLVLSDDDERAAGAENADIADLSYEDARDELITVVARLEAGGEPLETALALWERGEALAARCQEWLDGAQARLTGATAPEAVE